MAGDHGRRCALLLLLAASSACRMPSRSSAVPGPVMMVPGSAANRGKAKYRRLCVPQMTSHRGLPRSMRAAVMCSCGSHGPPGALCAAVTCAVRGTGDPGVQVAVWGGRVAEVGVPPGERHDAGRGQRQPGEQGGDLGEGAGGDRLRHQGVIGLHPPEMTMHYAKTLAETHEAEFLRFAKIGRDARPLEMDPADVYELVQLHQHTDRILPNGVCLLPPPKRCDRGNACLTCDHFATDARHPGELRAQLAGTEELIQARQAQHRQRTGTEMGPGHVWLAERTRELASLRAIAAALEAGQCPGAVRGAGVAARPGQPVPVTISKKPEGHGDAG